MLSHGASAEMKLFTLIAVGTLLLLSSLQVPASAAEHPSLIGAAANWPAPHADSDETAYSRLDLINTSDIGRLGLAWSLDLPGEVSLESTPLAVDGTLYFTGSYATVYAVDGASGKLLWSYAPETWKNYPMKMIFSFAANRGVAYENGRIFAAALDGRLFALDHTTGKLLWSVETTAPQSMQTITGAPRTFNGKVIIGNAGADMGLRGYVTAYDQATGKQLWRFYTVPASPDQNRGDPAMERAADTWRGEYWKTGTGGAVWDNITFDSDLNRIYLGTGNAGPYNPEARSPGGGDNLYTASIVALDADTGKYVWHYQINPRDSWDYDCTQQMTLADLTIDGKPRKVLMQAPKNGFFYVLDRTSGALISAEKYGKVTWASSIDLKSGRPVEETNIRYETGESTIWPSTSGAHSWMSQSFDPKTGLMYIPYMQSGVRFVKGKPAAGGVFVGGMGIKEVIANSTDGKGALLAWDPVQQKQVWKVPHDDMWNGGALASAGDLVFQGTAGGDFSAYNATTGVPLWKYDAGMGIIAAPMSYSVNGKQYVSVLAGYGGSAAIWGDLMNVGWKFSSPRRLLTFALDGNAPHPPSPPRDMTLHPVDDPSIKINPADAAAGYGMFLACAACHGRGLVSTGGPAPELRESKLALNPDSFYSVVHDGALMPNGMPGYGFFSRQQVMQLYAYVRSGAREAKEKSP
jgi:quinohemoprotein ethanol dehydrogenase